jgi:hypothetical protein
MREDSDPNAQAELEIIEARAQLMELAHILDERLPGPLGSRG